MSSVCGDRQVYVGGALAAFDAEVSGQTRAAIQAIGPFEFS